MMLLPKYAETLIVGVKLNSNFSWYISDKELWYLDLRKLIQAYEKKGFLIPESEDFSNRFNIDIVNEDNAEQFLSKMSAYVVKTEELSTMIKDKAYQDIGDIVPSIYIDFDKRTLISNYPEPASYELFIPDNWCGKYNSFNELIPDSHRYWMIGDKNCLEEYL